MHYRLVECTRCDLAYANPAPEAAALAEDLFRGEVR
jgi:hypothetical protein